MAALEGQAVVAAGEQAAAAIDHDELTASSAQVQVLMAAVDSAVAAAADQERGDCMRALLDSQDLAVVAIGGQAAATAVTPQSQNSR